jgi:hypothetical protein
MYLAIEIGWHPSIRIAKRVTWPRGKAEVRKTFYEGSNPSVTAPIVYYGNNG